MRGSIKQRSPGSWTIVYDLPRAPDGKRQQRRQTFRGTRKEAERELNRLLVEVGEPGYVSPSRDTVAVYLRRWLTDYAAHHVTPTTYQAYESHIRCHLIPALGEHHLADLTALHLQQYQSHALTNGRKLGEGGLSRRTVRHHHVILKEALSQAVRWGLLSRNPADMVDAPRVNDEERHSLNEEQFERLLRVVQGTGLAIPVTLALGTGMRRGEIMAVRWSDIDLENGTLWVRRSLMQFKGRLEFKQPKTAKGRRMIPLPTFAVEALVRHKGQQAAWRLEVGSAYQDEGLVIAGEDGKPMRPDTISKAFADLAESLGFPEVRFHDLRHTHATLLLKAGEHIKVVSERLGHARTDTTMNIYAHSQAGMHESAAKRLDDILKKATG